MKKKIFISLSIISAIVLIAAVLFLTVFKDSGNRKETFIKQTINDMSLEEKVGQLVQINLASLYDDKKEKGILSAEQLANVLQKYKVGSVVVGPDSIPYHATIDKWKSITDELQSFNSKYSKVPILFGIDAVHGFTYIKDATVYPHNLGMAATFNPNYAYEAAKLTAAELEACGFQWNFSPVLDVSSNPKWGRTYETFGEDPVTVAQFGIKAVQGCQESGRVAACAKHFIGYGASNNGKDRYPASISQADMLEKYLPPFQAAIQQGVMTAMINSGAVNGVPANGSNYIINQLLKGELGFKGVAISDSGDVVNLAEKYKIADSPARANSIAYNAGLDMDMVPTDFKYIDALLDEVRAGNIPMKRVDDAVKSVLTLKYDLGMLESTVQIDLPKDHREKANALAKKIAVDSMTWLDNQPDRVKHLNKAKKILIVGAADSMNIQCGGWTYGWNGFDAGEKPITGFTILDAIRKKRPDAKVDMADNLSKKEFLEKAKKYDSVIMAVTEEPYAEWTGDNPSLKVDSPDVSWSYEVENVDVILFVSGRPLLNMRDAKDCGSGLLWAYLPGSMGGEAVADVLFDDPDQSDAMGSGRLPITIPRDIDDLPSNYYQRYPLPVDDQYPNEWTVGYSAKVSKDVIKSDGVKKVLNYADGVLNLEMESAAMQATVPVYASCKRINAEKDDANIIVNKGRRVIGFAKANDGQNSVALQYREEDFKYAVEDRQGGILYVTPQSVSFYCENGKLYWEAE